MHISKLFLTTQGSYLTLYPFINNLRILGTYCIVGDARRGRGGEKAMQGRLCDLLNNTDHR
jgi:hypothetical protein